MNELINLLSFKKIDSLSMARPPRPEGKHAPLAEGLTFKNMKFET